ncbi:hypothetical protein D3C72_1168140 [compost metagenome]
MDDGAGVGDVVHVVDGEVGHLAELERADVAAAEHRGAALGGELEGAVGAVAHAVAHAAEQERLAGFGEQGAAVVARGAVDGQAHRGAGFHELHGAADAAAQSHVRAGAVGDARPGAAEQRHLGVVEVDAVGEPHVRAQPVQVLEQLQGAHAEGLQAEALLVERLGEVGVQAQAVGAGVVAHLGHQAVRHRERRAGHQVDAGHRAVRSIMVTADHAGHVGHDRVFVLDHRVGRQAAGALAERHGAAAGVHADADVLGGLDHRVEHHVRALGEDVEHVRDRRAAGEGQLGEAAHRAPVDHLGVQAGPDRVLGGQPLEQFGVLGGGHAAGERLVEVVVGVDQAGHGQAAGQVDRLLGLADDRRGVHQAVVLDPHLALVPVAGVAHHGRDHEVLEPDGRHGSSQVAACAARIGGTDKRAFFTQFGRLRLGMGSFARAPG